MELICRCLLGGEKFNQKILSNDKIISWTSGRDYFVLSFSLKERVLLIL